jgi:hypothetical protein
MSLIKFKFQTLSKVGLIRAKVPRGFSCGGSSSRTGALMQKALHRRQ